MKNTIFVVGFILATLSLSCKNGQEESVNENPEIIKAEPTPEVQNEISSLELAALIKSLQGNWKESEYPFRRIIFKDTLVKFIEEGVAEEPEFHRYILSKACPFDVNNIKNVGPDDIILSMQETATCEKLQISNKTLTLRGFSTNTGGNYQIVYEKTE